jgi:starch synthase (maltosyl-transferring)
VRSRDLPDEGRARVVVEGVWPQVDAGRFPVKRIVGDEFAVHADVFADGHDELSVRLRWRRIVVAGPDGSPEGWSETAMEPLGNDRWRASFRLTEAARYEYAVCGWIDRFGTWTHDLRKRIDAGQDVAVDLLIGAELIAGAAARATAKGERAAAGTLRSWSQELAAPVYPGQRARRALDADLVALAQQFPDRSLTSESAPYPLIVDRERATFSAWYELFPRSASPDPKRHGTFRDVIARLPYVAGMGFDVLYLPPIHPIGMAHRKAANNRVGAGPSDPGVPWAIGGEAGGHTAIHPQLGTLEDFADLLEAARDHGVEVALDVAFQASPDHPWVRKHPEWFRTRPDGSIQYAENPPKRYQDIVPFDFETGAWRELWEALADVFRFWIAQGVRIFRVDNPHTKAFPFWEWCVTSIKAAHPDVLFLAEAFTRPRVMERLAKLGFSQSYTYFTWRNGKEELVDYMTELTTPPLSEYFRPNFWPNTPDILHEVLQVGGRPMFVARAVLAATLTGNFGIYGPAFELGEHLPIEPGAEEYLDSEKYQQRTWKLDRADSLRPVLTALNGARRRHVALQRPEGLVFLSIDNDQMIAYARHSPDRSDLVLVVVNLDPHREQTGELQIDFDALALDRDRPLELVDELTGRPERWHGPRQRLSLGPDQRQALVLAVRQPVGVGA